MFWARGQDFPGSLPREKYGKTVWGGVPLVFAVHFTMIIQGTRRVRDCEKFLKFFRNSVESLESLALLLIVGVSRLSGHVR